MHTRNDPNFLDRQVWANTRARSDCAWKNRLIGSKQFAILSVSFGQIESIIGIQWGQENLNPRVHRSTKNEATHFSLERWTRGIGIFLRPHWTSLIDSFSHIPSPNSFKNDSFSLFEHGRVEIKERNKKFLRSQTILIQKCSFCSKKTHTHTWYFYSQLKESYRRLKFWITEANTENWWYSIWNLMTSKVACRLSRI